MKLRTIGVAAALCLACFALMNAQGKPGEKVSTIKEAMALDSAGKHDEAVEALKQIISRTPKEKNKQAYQSLGLVYFRDGEYDLALENFSNSVGLDKMNPMAYYFLGMIYEKKALGTSKFEVAKDMKTKALKAWQDYLAIVSVKNPKPDVHKNLEFSIAEGIKRANKHIKILKEGLSE